VHPGRLPAALAAAALALALAPVSARATDEPQGGVDKQTVRPQPVVHRDPAPRHIRQRATDTLSLYAQAGLTPSGRVRRLAAAEQTGSPRRRAAATLAARPSARTSYDPSGNVIPPGLKSHVDQFCGGTGVDGTRVQVMYVRETDMPDRFAQVAPILRNEMRYIDDAFAISSMETGGGKRVRWVHDGSCNLSVLDVVLPDGSISGTYGETHAALNAAGYLQANRKYLAFADVPMGGLGGLACGMGGLYNDSRPTDNLNDGRYPQLARIDLECWVTSDSYFAAPLHELVHTLGAVLPEAPNGTAGFHCTDGAETMCYNDGTATVTEVCPGMQHDIDCNNDDYFNTHPPAGSYLDTHWNAANSPFLETVPRLSDPPTLRVLASTPTPETGDVVNFTADVATGTEVRWLTDSPQCENTGAPTTGTTYSIRCFDTAAPTVTAIASTPTGYTASSVDTSIAYTQGPYPTLVIGGPDTAMAGKAFALTATVDNSSSPWTYRWTNRSGPGCTITGGSATATLTATCNDTMVGRFGTFTGTATRTADGATLTETAGVQIVSATAPQVTITGPTSVVAGEQASFTAEVRNASSPTYQWSSAHNWGQSAAQSVRVSVPATAVGTDTLFLTVTSASGERTSVDYTYSIEPAFTMTLNGPGRLVSGTTGRFTATPSRAADIVWSSNESACPLVPSEADPTTARLTCAEDFDGWVTVTAVGRNGGDVVTRSKPVEVSPEAQEPVDTDVSLRVSSGNPTRFTVALHEVPSGNPVPGATVNLEFRRLQGIFEQVRTVSLDGSGADSFEIPATRAGHYRVVFLGSSAYAPSASAKRRVYVPTAIANDRVRRGVRATLTTATGAPLAGEKLVLQKRRAGARAWRTAGTYVTSSKGRAVCRVDASRRTNYRWTYAGSHEYRGDTSAVVTLA